MTSSSSGGVDSRLDVLGIELPSPLPAFGQYVPAVVSGDLLHVGGHFGTRSDGAPYTGKAGGGVSVDQAREAARSAALNLLSTVRAAAGSLDAVAQVVSVHGVVNAAPDFTQHTHIIDAASDVLVDVLGDAGRHARLAVGVSSLPADLVLEITAVMRLR